MTEAFSTTCACALYISSGLWALVAASPVVLAQWYRALHGSSSQEPWVQFLHGVTAGFSPSPHNINIQAAENYVSSFRYIENAEGYRSKYCIGGDCMKIS